MDTVTQIGMKVTNIILTAMALSTGAVAITSCKEKKQDEEIIVEKLIEKPKNSATAMQNNTKNDAVKWIGGRTYTYIVEREKDTELPLVENHDVTYYDNRIQLTIKRSDGTDFFSDTFTKNSFTGLLNNDMKEHGVLLSMAFDKCDSDNMYFVVGIGSPDESYEDFTLVQLIVSRTGATSVSTYTPPELP